MDQDTPSPQTVGYKNPPKQHRFKKGQSGNPKGRPRKAPVPQPSRIIDIDVGAILNEPIEAVLNGQVKSMSAFEASMRKRVQKAIKKQDVRAICFLLKFAVQHRLLLPRPTHRHISVLQIPRRWNEDTWNERFKVNGPPPWDGDDDGFTDEDRARYEAGRL